MSGSGRRRGAYPHQALRLAVWILLALLWGTAIEEWNSLPARIPMHFDASGRPDAFVDRTPQAWFMLPAVATALCVGIGLILPLVRWLVLVHPWLVNVPFKSRWLTLDGAARLHALAPMFNLLGFMQASIAAIFLFMVWGIARVAHQPAGAIAIWPVMALIGGVLGGVVAAVAMTARHIQKVGKVSTLEP